MMTWRMQTIKFSGYDKFDTDKEIIKMSFLDTRSSTDFLPSLTY